MSFFARHRLPSQAATRKGERGQALVLVALMLAVLVGLGAYAIDTAEWWDHGHHLQEQADAAALAAARDYVAGCTSGSSTETSIASAVAQYAGAASAQGNGYSGTASSPYNQQIYPTASGSGGHSLTALINSNTFGTGNYAGSSQNPLTGHPCADGVIDVKLTEAGLGSILPFTSPTINAEAEVGFYEASAASDTEPFVFEDDLPSHMWVQLRDVSTDQAVGSAVALTPPTGSSSAWTGTLSPGSLADSSSSPSTYNLGLRVIADAFATSNNVAPSCPTDYSGHVQSPNGVVCYDIGSTNPTSAADEDGGVSLIRVWVPYDAINPSGTQTPGLPYSAASPVAPAAPQADDVWLVPSSDSCGSGPSTDAASFTDSSTTQDVVLCANMVFTSTNGTPMSSCSNASMTATVIPTLEVSSSQTTSTATMTCPSGGPNGVWSSQAVAISANSGPTFFGLSWGLYTGNCPVEDDSSSNNQATCGGYSQVTGRLTSSSQNSGEQTSGTHHGSSCTSGSPCICNSTYPCACNTNTCACVPAQACLCTSSNPCKCNNYICTCGSGSTYECQGSFDGYSAEGVNGTCAFGTTTFTSSGSSSCGEIVQGTWAGPWNQYAASFNRAGPIESVSLTDPVSGNPVQSVQSSSTSSTINVSLSLVPGFADDSVTNAGNPISLNAGDDDFSGEWDCAKPVYNNGGSLNGSDPGGSATFNKDIQWWIEEGCNTQTVPSPPALASPPTTAPPSSTYESMSIDPSSASPPSCSGASGSPSTSTSYCVQGTTDPDITYNLYDALDERIYGMTCSPGQACTGNVNCNNYWNSSNSVASIQSESPTDPRLVVLPLTYYGAFYPNAYVSPSTLTVPIIGFAEFYLTGWWGDPCASGGSGTGVGTVASNGLTVSADDSPPIDPDESGAIDGDLSTEDSNYNCLGAGLGSSNCAVDHNSSQVACTSSSPSYTTSPYYCSDQGVIMGHFVTSVTPVGQGTASSTQCTASTLGICVAVLNK
jgi:hypothetical protein